MKENPQNFYDLSPMYLGSRQGLDDMNNLMEKFNAELRKPQKDRNFGLVLTKLFKLDYEALIAVNSIFAIKYDFDGNIINDLSDVSKYIAPTFLNIFPQNGETFILLSCISSDNPLKTIIDRLVSFCIEEIENFFSNIILMHCENFFLSPKKWNLQPKNTRKEFVSIFTDTALIRNDPNYLSYEAPLNLFNICRKEEI